MHTYNTFDRAARTETLMTVSAQPEVTVIARMMVCDSEYNYNERPLFSVLVKITTIDNKYTDHEIIRVETDHLHDDFCQPLNAKIVVDRLLPGYISFKEEYGYEKHTKVYDHFHARLYQPVIHDMVLDQLPADV